MSTAVYIALQGDKGGRSWEKMVGYTLGDLRTHLESQFRVGMTWANMGAWHIDHIIPKAFFRFTSERDVEFKMCWRLENLQPLWAEENMRKHTRVEYA